MLYEESSNDDGGYGQVHSRTSRREEVHSRTSRREELLSGYAIYSPCTFKSLRQFKKVCITSSAALADGKSGEQYAAFENVTSKNLEDIDKWREDSNKNLPRVRILYDQVSEILIVKFMPGTFHDIAAGLFDRILLTKLPDIFSLVALGAARFEGMGRAKEGNCGYKPRTRILSNAWPSLMVEVGVSESLQQLRNDARFWLTNSAGETRVVIVMAVDKATRKVEIERWEDVGRIRLSRQSTPRYNLGMVQSIRLEHGVQYAGPALGIPAAKVYDLPLPPNVMADDFELTAQDLETFKNRYWEVLQ